MLWHAMTRRAWNGRLVWTPAVAVALYPIEMLLAPLGASNHMRAIVARP
jgi:hypothetical protein